MPGRLTRPTIAVLALVLAATVGCSGGGSASPPSTTADTRPATTVAPRPTVPTVPTTLIPGGPAPSGPAGATVPPPPATTVPGAGRTGTTAAPPASSPADPAGSATTAAPAPAPGSTAPPATAPADGDPATFCPALETLIPLFYVNTIGSLQGTSTAAAYEVAVAPALTGPLGDTAASAPAAVAAPFRAWADRTTKALAAFKAAGASDALTTSFGQSYAAQIDALTSKGGTQSPPDPVNAAVKAGVDRSRLMSSAASFQAANGPFDAFAATFGQQLKLAPADEQALEQRFPCAGDLANFSS